MDIEPLLAIFAGLLGGLLVNYFADALPESRGISSAGWWPVSSSSLSSYFSRKRVLLVQATVLLLGFALWRWPMAGWAKWEAAVILIYLGIVVVIDIEHRAILHPVSAAGAILFGFVGLLRQGWVSTLYGGLSGFGILLILYWLGERLGAWIAKRRGLEWEDTALGFGDVILAGVIGLLLGWPGIVGGLFLGVMISGVYSGLFVLLTLVRGNYKIFTSIPYGPFLAMGAIALIAISAYL